MIHRQAAFAGLAAVVLLATGASAGGKPGLPDILPADLETEIALSAAPSQLRDGVAVYLLGKKGYELSRPGTNGFSCLVIRGSVMGPPAWRESISGWCYDAHGMETFGKVDFDRAKLLRQGTPAEEVSRKISAGFASGKYRAPSQGGVIYMLSPVNKVPDHRTGELYTYPPHIMYYAPFVSNDDIGVPESAHTGDPDYVFSGLPFLPVSGPHGFIVQPLGRLEAARLVDEHRSLIERVEKYVEIDTEAYAMGGRATCGGQ